MGRWALWAVAVAALVVAAAAAGGLLARESSTELAIVAGALAVAVVAGGGAALGRRRARRRALADDGSRFSPGHGDPAAAHPAAHEAIGIPTDEPALDQPFDLEALEPPADDQETVNEPANEPAGAPGAAREQTTTLVSPWDPPGLVDLTGASPEEIRRGVAAGERALIDQLVDDGKLSGGGPLSDDDVGTLVFVAVSSGELLGALLERDLDGTSQHSTRRTGGGRSG